MKDLNHNIVKTLMTIPDFALFGSIFGGAVLFLKKYIFNDFEFLTFLCVAIAVDTLLAIAYHIKNGTISSEGINKFTVKMIAYGSTLVLMHLLESFTVKGVHYELHEFPSYMMYAIFFIRELTSIAEKIECLRPRTLPRFIAKFLKIKSDE